MICELKGNLAYVQEYIILHGCNCFDIMGAGVAKALVTRWPIINSRESLKSLANRGDYQRLGQICPIQVNDRQTVINCYTQYSFGRDQQHADYEAIQKALLKVKVYCEQKQIFTIASSPIGCGLAGGDWDIVKDIFGKVFDNYTIHIYRL